MRMSTGAKLKLKDIAAEAGVSVATVSRIMAGQTGVRSEVRERIMSILRVKARTGSLQPRNAVCLIGHHSWDLLKGTSWHDRFSAGAQSVLSVEGISLYTNVLNDPMNAANFEEMLAKFDGIIIAQANLQDQLVTRLLELNFPFVTLGSIPGLLNIPYVDCNSLTGGYIATKHLLALGHDRIGCVCPNLLATYVVERLYGYRQALLEADLGYSETNVLQIPPIGLDEQQNAIKAFLKEERRPTALFAVNDALAVVVIKTAIDMGLSVPGDLSVIGFDDDDIASLTVPALTTVRWDMERQGAEAAGMLMALVREEELSRRQIVLPIDRVVVRRSTAAP